MIPQEIINFLSTLCGIVVGSYITSRFIIRSMKKEIPEIAEKYIPRNTKKRVEKVLINIETLINNANRFLGVKKNDNPRKHS